MGFYKKILLLGKDGQVGWELRRTLATLGEVTALDSRALDLSDADAIRRQVAAQRPRRIMSQDAATLPRPGIPRWSG